MNTITFGSITSSTYGIYISGEGVWNAPERDAEVIEIPGRNGAFIRDYGNFKNIQVTYRVFNQEASYSDFRTKIDNFRNALASQKGYQKLTDTFHPDEYRMAAFIGGMEVKPIMINDKASEFEITFECKPQRFKLIYDQQTGLYKEEVDPISSGSSITNSTLFDAHPLLEFVANGSAGTITIGGKQIKVTPTTLGETILYNGGTVTSSGSITLDSNLFNQNNTITVNAIKGIPFTVTHSTYKNFDGFRNSTSTNMTLYNCQANGRNGAYVEYGITSKKTDVPEFSAGTSGTFTGTASIDINFKGSSSSGVLVTVSTTFTVAYNASTNKITFTTSVSATGSTVTLQPIEVGTVSVASTKSPLQNQTVYIDLDIGEAYVNQNGTRVSVNNMVDLGGELPALAPGNSTISYSGCVSSDFKITPRWWTV